MFHSLLNHLPIVEHLGGFQDFPIMNRAAINISLQIEGIFFSVIFMVYTPRRGNIGSKARNTFMAFVVRCQTALQKACANLQFSSPFIHVL